MIRVLRLFLLVLVFSLIGCASSLKVTYQSDPPGASVYEGSRMLGYAPVTANYALTEEDKKTGSKQLLGTTAKWASGATASITYLTADLRQFGLSQSFTFQRPDAYPNREADLQFAIELQKLAVMRQQSQALQNQAAAQARQTQALIDAASRPINCTSRVVGSFINTECN